MANDSERPIIIKRKKVISGGGHHGGAWKVAYADFVTAMMAFFMLMWLLNATTEKQRKGLADYFSPTIPIVRISGGGEGAFGGTSTFTQEAMMQNGSGGLGSQPGVVQQALGSGGSPEEQAAKRAEETEKMEAAQEVLMGLGGGSLVEEMALRHVQSRVTDEGLVIELFDVEGSPLFDPDTANPTEMMRTAVAMLARVSVMIENGAAIAGYTQAMPIVVAQDRSWDLSSERAHALRAMMVSAGLSADRIVRVTGHADRQPATTIPTDVRNNRVELIFLRSDRR